MLLGSPGTRSCGGITLIRVDASLCLGSRAQRVSQLWTSGSNIRSSLRGLQNFLSAGFEWF